MKNVAILKKSCEISSLLSVAVSVFTGAVCFFAYCAFSFYYFFYFIFKNRFSGRLSKDFTAIA